jgi:hypothetical protein
VTFAPAPVTSAGASVFAGGFTMTGTSSPCADCPWRKDAPPAHWHDDHFLDIWRECQDDGTHVMLCHKAAKLPPERRSELPCRGWVLVVGTDAVGVRLLLMSGRLKASDLNAAPNCPPLVGSFGEMMKANGVKPPRRNRVTG